MNYHKTLNKIPVPEDENSEYRPRVERPEYPDYDDDTPDEGEERARLAYEQGRFAEGGNSKGLYGTLCRVMLGEGEDEEGEDEEDEEDEEPGSESGSDPDPEPDPTPQAGSGGSAALIMADVA